MSPVVP